jgi:class 3 adenylate cyclase
MGDQFCAVFTSPQVAVQAALAAQRALRRELPQVRVRMALHTGAAQAREGDYFGPALNRVARLLAAGHGGDRCCSRELLSSTRGQLCRMIRTCAYWGSTGCGISPQRR